MAMLIPHMMRRRRQVGIQTWLTRKMDIFLPAPEVPLPPAGGGHDLFPHPGFSNERKRCRECLGEKNTKKEKEKIPRNIPQCQMCAESVCKSHTVRVCTACAAGLQVNKHIHAPRPTLALTDLTDQDE